MKKKYYSFKEMVGEFNTRPKKTFLWNGIKEKSFGIIFGAPKSGKTIMCENLAINIAIGKNNFLEYNLSGTPKKTLFIGLEEFWEERVERNLKQYQTLSDNDKILMDDNYLFQAIDFSRKIVKKEDWENLNQCIIDSKAEVVFIDSITRMNHGKIEDSKTAEEIMQRLRTICYDNGITLICIHHTPKLNGGIITMDSIKGSSTFSAESDFAIGINRTLKGFRYLKNVFFRYASDNDDTVKEFEINQDTIINYISDVEEDEVIARSDRRRSIDKRIKMLNYFSENPNTTFNKVDLVNYFTNHMPIKKRMVENYLKEFVDTSKVECPNRGTYKYIKPINNENN